ncbi:hypothetical protein K4F52_000301 [Lecanicillium sp. MT-2017a]|nr:hypothetical protein K4F52_000301 [Lecanicillium sp. MT-2017a]
MKSALLLALVAGVWASRHPGFNHDPETIKSCVEWVDNDGSKSCKEIRDYFGISPEQFKKWNPSISLDCEPWHDFVSYCVNTQKRVDDYSKSHSTSTPTPTTSMITASTTSLGPSPTAWEELGCYVDSPDRHILEKLVSDVGDNAGLTIPKCQDACYRAGCRFAGVQSGNQCWCSSYVGGEFAKDDSECDKPCAGDDKTICGGKNRLIIFKADEPQHKVVTTTTVDKLFGTGSPAGSTSSSGAMKNAKLF